MKSIVPWWTIWNRPLAVKPLAWAAWQDLPLVESLPLGPWPVTFQTAGAVSLVRTIIKEREAWPGKIFHLLTQLIPHFLLPVYGPHVGVDANGKVGTVNRRGRKHGGACCGSATAAAVYCQKCISSKTEEEDDLSVMSDPLDAQQQFVNRLLLPYAPRLENASDKSVEIPKALFDAEDELLNRIVAQACGKVSAGNIALVGGIQINTPDGMSDYFLPLRVQVQNNQGALLQDFLAQHKPIPVRPGSSCLVYIF